MINIIYDKIFFVLLIVVLVLVSGCTQEGLNYSTTPTTDSSPSQTIKPVTTKSPSLYSNTTPNGTEIKNIDNLSKCGDDEIGGTEDEIDGYLEDGHCKPGTKREGMYPFSLESIGSQKDIYTKGFCCKIASLPGQDF